MLIAAGGLLPSPGGALDGYPNAQITATSATKPQTVAFQNGERLTYIGGWDQTVLTDAAGVREATISGIAYTLYTGRSKIRRPIFLIFNGGPDASRSPLHLGLAGPLRMAPLNFVRNDETFLDVADLVGIDLVEKTSPDIAKFLRKHADVTFGRPYGSLSLKVNFDFNWQPASRMFEANGGWRGGEGLAELVEQRASAQILVTAGYYDLATPTARVFHDADHLNSPLTNVEQRQRESGDTNYSTLEARSIMSRAIHRPIALTNGY